MNDSKLRLISIIILAISILISSIIISNSLKNINNDNVLTVDQAANYLKISPEEMEHLIEYPPPTGMPYLKVNDKYIFTKKGLDEWIVYTNWEK